MSNLLVTGGLGFIGSNFIDKILNQKNNKFKILNLDKISQVSSIKSKKKFQKYKNYKFIKCDLKDALKTNKIIKTFKPNIVLHFAAESHVDNSINSPESFIYSNIIGTYNLVNSCNLLWNKKKFTKFIHVSTDEVYGSLSENSNSFTEASNYQPNSPYSSSKASSDLIVRSWNKTFGFNSIITNCSNNFGPGQHPEKLIPKTIFKAINKQNVPIYGNGKNIRDWIYVDDHINALIKIVKYGKIGEKYNIGGGIELNNIQIVKKILSYLNETINDSFDYTNLIKFVPDRPGHDFRYSINDNKIREKLKFKNKSNFNQSLRKTVDWYLANLDYFS